MAGVVPYLLDTHIVLITTRLGNSVAALIDQAFELRASPFRLAVCKVPVAETLAFAHAWGAQRRRALDEVIDELIVLPITPRAVHAEWARLRSHAKDHGLAIQHDHYDLWIAAAANLAGLTMITADAAGFRPLRAAGLVRAWLIDPRSGHRLPRPSLSRRYVAVTGPSRPLAT